MLPVRIAFVLPHLRMGGIEHVVVRLLAGLDRKKFVPLLFLRSPVGELLAQVPADVIRGDGRGTRALFMAPLLARWLRSERVSIAYSGTNAINLTVLMAARLIGRAHRPRVIVSEHTSAGAYLASAKGGRARRAAIRRLYPGADLLLAPAEHLCREWAALIGPASPPTAVAPNPILDPVILQSLRDAPPARQPGLIISAGRLIDDKGHDIVLRAFAAIAPSRPWARLAIFGAGSKDAALLALIEELGLSGRADLMGTTPHLIHEMAKAQVLAVGSRREGFGNVVVEGLAAGARVVSTDCPGPRAILQEGRLGRLVPRNDVAAMSVALSDALDARPDTASRGSVAAALTPYLIPSAIANFEAQALSLAGMPGDTFPALGSFSRHDERIE